MSQLHVYRVCVAVSLLHVCRLLRDHVATSRVSSLRGHIAASRVSSLRDHVAASRVSSLHGHVAAPRGRVCAVMSQLHVVETAWPYRSFTCVESA